MTVTENNAGNNGYKLFHTNWSPMEKVLFFHFTSMINFEALLLEEHTSYLRHWTQFRGKMSVNRIYPPQASEGRPYEAYIQHDQYTLDTAVNT